MGFPVLALVVHQPAEGVDMEKLEKRMWRFILMFFALLALLVGCGEVCDAPVYPNDTARGESEAAKVKSVTRFSRNYLSGNLLTVEHDGHLWGG